MEFACCCWINNQEGMKSIYRSIRKTSSLVARVLPNRAETQIPIKSYTTQDIKYFQCRESTLINYSPLQCDDLPGNFTELYTCPLKFYQQWNE